MCRCAYVCVCMFKMSCRWPEVPEVPAVCRTFQRLGGLALVVVGWLNGGVLQRSEPGLVALATVCKIATFVLLVTVGFFIFPLLFFSPSPWRGTSGTTENRSHLNTEQWAVSTLLHPLLSSFFPIVSSHSAPVPPSITKVQ